MILRLTDGTNTTNLTGGPIYRVEYVPRSPELSMVEFEPATLMDGGEIVNITRRNVAEQCDITIAADTTAEVEASLHEIEQLFANAIEFQNRRGGVQLYIEYSADDVTVYRSEILYGRTELGKQPLRWLVAGPALSVGLIWKRRYYWELSTESRTVLQRRGAQRASRDLSDIAITNTANSMAIDGAEITGTLPVPARIEIANTYATDTLGTVMIGHNVYADPGDLSPLLEAEYGNTYVGSVEPDASCSNGEYMDVDLVASRELLLTWTIPAAQLSHYRGRFFRLLLRLQRLPGPGTYLQPKILLGVGTSQVAAEGQETLLSESKSIQDLGTLQIPPYLMGNSGTFTDIVIALYGRRVGSGSLGIDYLFLMPTDSYRELRPRTYGADNGITIIDDGGMDTISLTGYGGGGDEVAGFYYSAGTRVMLVPGRDQTLYFLLSNTSGGCEIDRSATVTVSYRPRRYTM